MAACFMSSRPKIIGQRARIEQQREKVAQLERQGRDAQTLKAARGRLAMMVQTLTRMEAEYAATPETPGSRNLR
jgi:type VI protein secretion system component VasF